MSHEMSIFGFYMLLWSKKQRRVLRTIAFAQLRAEDTRNHAPEPQRSLQSSREWLLKDSGKLDFFNCRNTFTYHFQIWPHRMEDINVIEIAQIWCLNSSLQLVFKFDQNRSSVIWNVGFPISALRAPLMKETDKSASHHCFCAAAHRRHQKWYPGAPKKLRKLRKVASERFKKI